MKTGSIVARLGTISFQQNDDVHTISQAKAGQQLANMGGSGIDGNFKTVICEPNEGFNAYDIAYTKIRLQLRDWIDAANRNRMNTPLKYSDFTFTIRFSEVDANGEFWSSLSTTTGINHTI